MSEYFGENYESRVKDAFEITKEIDPALATRIAVALAVITYSEIPDTMLAPHLQRRQEVAGTGMTSEAH
jgi:hypothetical protein